MKKFLFNVLFIIYVVIAAFITICLLSFNQFRTTIFGNYALINITNDEFNPDFQRGDLVIVDKSKKINVGDKVFLYATYEQLVGMTLAEVTNEEVVSSVETTYYVDGDHMVSSQYVLGATNATKIIPKAGTVLSFLESKWGFLFLIVLPAVLAFLNQLAVVITEIKGTKDDE